MKTILFEKKTGQDMSKVTSIDQVNSIVEDKYGKLSPMKRVDEDDRLLSRKGNIFKMKTYCLEGKIDEELR